MSSEEINYLIEHIVSLRQVHHYSLKKVLRLVNILIAIYKAKNSFSPDERIRADRKIAKATEDMKTLDKINDKIRARLNQLEKTLKILLKE